MRKLQVGGVQKVTIQRPMLSHEDLMPLLGVCRVPNHGVTDRTQMDSDLMCPSGTDPNFEQ